MPLIGEKVTPKMIAANRRNSLKSAGPRWATRRTVLRLPTGRPPLSCRGRHRPSQEDERQTAEVNEGKKHEISIKETKPLLAVESAT